MRQDLAPTDGIVWVHWYTNQNIETISNASLESTCTCIKQKCLLDSKRDCALTESAESLSNLF